MNSQVCGRSALYSAGKHQTILYWLRKVYIHYKNSKENWGNDSKNRLGESLRLNQLDVLGRGVAGSRV